MTPLLPRHKFLGAHDGDFNPNQSTNLDFLDAVDSGFLASLEDPRKVFYPSCKFTTRIVVLGVEDRYVSNEIITSRGASDGIIVDQANVAGVLFNADCPAIMVYESNLRRFALLHGGFRCLMPEVNSLGKRPKSIIDNLFLDFKFDPSQVKVWVTKGIGPCCYGAEHWPEMHDASVDIPIGRATRGSRIGKRSIDLYMLIYKQLLKYKVNPSNIFLETECTCCEGWFIKPSWHSNCRSGLKAGRNAIGFWMRQ